MDHRPGIPVLVAADRLPRGSVDMGQPVDPAPHQHRVHRGWSQTHPVGDLDRSQPLLPAQMHDLANHRRRRSRRRAVRTRGGIDHPRGPEQAIPLRPPIRGRPRHVIPLRRPSDRPPLLDDQPGQPQTGSRGQGCVSVGHEDLQGEERLLRQLHSTPGGLRLPSSFRPCRHTISTNVPDQYT